MTVDDMMDYIDVTLAYHNRRITPAQRNDINTHLKTHAYPVYAQMVGFVAFL